MIVVLCLLFLLCLVGTKYKKNKTNNDYMDKHTTSSICGVFVIIIFLSHLMATIGSDSWLDKPVSFFCGTFLGQLMVVPFLFYGAYGIVTQYKERGVVYLKDFPLQRILKTYITYIICIFIGKLVDYFASGCSSFVFNPLELVIWSNNYTWFIFIIIVEYILIWFCLLLFKDKKVIVSLLIFALSIGFAVILYKTNKAEYWFNTIIAFPFGVIFGFYKENIDKILSKRTYNILLSLLSIGLWLGTFLIIYLFKDLNFFLRILLYEIETVAFMSSIVLFTYNFNFGNNILFTLSKYTIYCYLLQICTFNLFASYFDTSTNFRYIYVLCCIAMTVCLCIVVKYINDKTIIKTLKKIKFDK